MDINKAIENNIPVHLQNQNIVNFITSFVNVLTNIELDINKLRNSVFINTAKGRELDDLGELFKLPRLTDETDTSYRQRIKSYYQILLSYGTVNGIKKAISILLNISEDIIDIQEIIEYKPKLIVSDISENWTGASVSFDNDYKYYSRGLKLTGDTNIIASLSKTMNLRITNINVDMFKVWCYIEDSTKIDELKLIFYDGSELAEYEITSFETGVNEFEIPRSSFTGSPDWKAIIEVRFDVVFNASSSCYFGYITEGSYGNTNKFNVSIEVNEYTEFDSIKDLTTVINNSKAAGIYYNSDNINFTSEDNIFMINLSSINSDDRLL